MRSLSLCISILAVALAVLAIVPATAKDVTAPDFTLKNVESKDVKLSDILEDHKLVLLDFWNLACKPCAEYMNAFDPWDEKYGDKGFIVVSVNIDSSQTGGKVKPYIEGREYKFLVLLDPNMEVYNRFGVKGVPTTFLINADREIVFRHLGYKKGVEKDVEAAIEANLPAESSNP